MSTAIKYYNKHSKAELIELTKAIEADPDNRELSENSIFTLNSAARKKLAAIAQAIAWHMEDDRRRNGNPVPGYGYSGRQTNRGS